MGSPRPAADWRDTLNRSTVGPEATLSKYAMYDANLPPPIEAQAWNGWPVEWNVPNYSSHGFGMYSVDPEVYLHRVSTAFTCVDLNSRQLASFPTYLVRGAQKERIQPRSWMENPEPNRYSGWPEFMREAVNSLSFYGELVIVATARYADGFPARFVCLNPATLTIEPNGSGGVTIRLAPDGPPIPREDYLFIRYQQLPMSHRGISPLQWTGRSLCSAAALESYAADLATHGVWSVLKVQGNLNQQQGDELRAAWMAKRQANPAAPALLTNGAEFDTLSLSPTDMALLDLRVFDEQRIAASFGVPAYLINLPSPGGMTYSNVSSVFDYHWRATLRVLADTIAQPLSSWALPHQTHLEFNRDEYVRPGLTERSQYYATLHGIQDGAGRPAVQVSEIRAAESLPPYSQYDERLPARDPESEAINDATPV